MDEGEGLSEQGERERETKKSCQKAVALRRKAEWIEQGDKE